MEAKVKQAQVCSPRSRRFTWDDLRIEGFVIASLPQ